MNIDWSTALTWTAVISVFALAVSLVVFPILVILLPADVLERALAPAPPAGQKLSAGRIVWRIVRNLLGAVLVLAGLLMLVTPGQGLLTLALGLALLDFPAKRYWLRRLLVRPAILDPLNRLRRRAGRPPLTLPAKPKRGAKRGK